MRRVLMLGLLISALVVGLTGCEWLTSFLDQLDTDGGNAGGGPPLGTPTVVSGRIEIGYQGIVELSSGGTSTETVGETFYTASGSYDATTRTFTATWNDAEFANTYLEVRLDASLDVVEYFYVRQMRTGMFGNTYFITEVEGHDVPYTHGGTSNGIPVDHYTVTGVTANQVITAISQKIWSTDPESVGVGTEMNPWKYLPSVTSLVADPNDDIMITLGWQ